MSLVIQHVIYMGFKQHNTTKRKCHANCLKRGKINLCLSEAGHFHLQTRSGKQLSLSAGQHVSPAVLHRKPLEDDFITNTCYLQTSGSHTIM